MKRFGYGRDPLFLLGCSCYAANRWILKAHFDGVWLHSWFNDFWLIPCALPPVLALHRCCGWRGDGLPTAWEIGSHLAGWSVLFEVLGPRMLAHTTGDLLDVFAYAAGAAGAYLWWHRDRWFRRQPAPA